MNIEVTNDKLQYIGLLNPANKIILQTAEVSEVGAVITQLGAKKASRLKMTVPINRSDIGTRRVAEFELNGSQMRELYNTLNEFYNVQTISGNT